MNTDLGLLAARNNTARDRMARGMAWRDGNPPCDETVALDVATDRILDDLSDEFHHRGIVVRIAQDRGSYRCNWRYGDGMAAAHCDSSKDRAKVIDAVRRSIDERLEGRDGLTLLRARMQEENDGDRLLATERPAQFDDVL